MAFIYGNFAFAQQSGPMVLVDSAEEVVLIEEVPITGSVISARIAKLSTEVSGIVERISIEIGDQVRAGDEILQLNSELDRLSLEAARAATESAIQELEDAKRRLNDAKVLAKRHSVSVNEIE
ncbi:MAG: biotin/lipoyl-binding protein, partial [Candidatus Thiodiazotropha endolucinida]